MALGSAVGHGGEIALRVDQNDRPALSGQGVDGVFEYRFEQFAQMGDVGEMMVRTQQCERGLAGERAMLLVEVDQFERFVPGLALSRLNIEERQVRRGWFVLHDGSNPDYSPDQIKVAFGRV